jgi:hypothetical protein
LDQAWWLIAIITATQEAEAEGGGSWFKARWGKSLSFYLKNKNKRTGMYFK